MILSAQRGTKLYTIKPGDTLWGIAKKYTGSGLNFKDVAKLNNISNPNLIYAGKTIKIPVKNSNTSLPSKYSNVGKPTKYILKPTEKLKIKLYEFKLPDNRYTTYTPKLKGSELKKNETVRSSNKERSVLRLGIKLYEFKLPESFPIWKPNNEKPSATKPSRLNKPLRLNKSSRLNNTTKVTHDYVGNSLSIINSDLKPTNKTITTTRSPIENVLRNLYYKIPEDYRAPISLLRSGNTEGLLSYISTAYDRKISNDYVGKQMNPLKLLEAEQTEKYRLSLPSTFDTKLASLQKRTGLLRRPILYMNMPYDINIKDYKWHYRQRGDMNPVQHTYGMLAPIFNQMTTKDKVKYHSGIIFNPNTGQLSVEPDLNKVPEGWLVNQVNYPGDGSFNVKGMRKDANGNLVMVTPNNTEYRHNFTTLYELTNGAYTQPNVFTDPNNRDPRTLGATAGGHFIISAEPKKGNRQVRLVHGSLQHLSDAIDRLKANTNTDYITVYPLDGGSFSMGYIPLRVIGKEGMLWTTIGSKEFNTYQNQNPRGSSGFMPIAKLPEVPDTTYITTYNK